MNTLRSFGWTNILAILLIAAPVGLQALLVERYGVNVPIGDEWGYIRFVTSVNEGNAWWEQLWRQHAQNRYILPKLLIALSVPTTGWNVVMLMYLAIIPTALALLGLWFIYRRAGNASLWLFIPAAWMLIHFSQYQNYLFGLQIGYLMSVAGVIWTIYWLARPERWAMGLAFGSAVFAAFSAASGLFILPIALVLLFGQRASWKRKAAWACASAILVAIYFYDFQSQRSSTSIVASLSKPITLIRYLLTVVGAPFGANQIVLAEFLGACLLVGCGALIFWEIRKFKSPPPRAWAAIALTFYGLATAGIISVGRAKYGIDQALTSRYISYTVLAYIGFYFVLLSHLPQSKPYKQIAFASLCLGMLIVLGSSYVGWKNAVIWTRNTARVNKVIVQQGSAGIARRTQAMALNKAQAHHLKKGIAYLESHHLSSFRDPIDWWLAPPAAKGKHNSTLGLAETVTQSFTCPVETLYDLGITIAPSKAVGHSQINLRLVDTRSQQALAARTVQVESPGPQTIFFMPLDVPLRMCQHVPLRLDVSSVPNVAADSAKLVTVPAFYEGGLQQGTQNISNTNLLMELNVRHFDIRDGE